MDTTLIVVGVIAIIIAIVFLVPVFIKARKVNLTETSDEKPEWMRSTPPAETQAATKAEGKGVTLFDHDAGEKLAAPFAEQIEDIIRAKLEADADLNQFQIDLGTAPDGGLEIWVNNQMYPDIESLPDERLQQIFKDAIKQWDRG